MPFELISFNVCPFVQRSVITLKYKKVPYKMTYIDLSHKPDWFLKISPFGKVPVLKVDQETSIFESAVINEFIDEITTPRLHPEDSVQRAHNRAWIEFGSACLVDQFRLWIAKDKKGYDSARHDYVLKLEQIEKMLEEGPYFNGKNFSLVDTAYAPLWMRQSLLQDQDLIARFPKIEKWSESLLQMESVRDSVPTDFKELFQKYLTKRESFAVQWINQ